MGAESAVRRSARGAHRCEGSMRGGDHRAGGGTWLGWSNSGRGGMGAGAGWSGRWPVKPQRPVPPRAPAATARRSAARRAAADRTKAARPAQAAAAVSG